MKLTRTFAFAAIVMVLTAAPLHAQGSAGRSPQAAHLKSANSTRSMIAGSVSDPQSKPVADARVRLRNLQTGQIDQTAVTNEAGEFRLVAVPDIPYVVELADAEGRIVSVSDVIIAHAGEVAATTLTAGTRLPALARLFGKAAGSVIGAMAGVGIPAAVGGPPLSPEK